VALWAAAFKASDSTPAVLSMRAGLVAAAPSGTQVTPVG
jgi:hypothetical protein